MKNPSALRCFARFVCALILVPSGFAQGPLIPPGAPAPTMKTLDQIEPRIPISSLPFAITQPGSYYLVTNLTGVANQDGITIAASNVTIDLNGFEIRGVAGASDTDGITLGSEDCDNITLRNGSIRGWNAYGANLDFGNSGRGRIIEDVRFVGNYGLSALRVGSGAVVRGCVAVSNETGIVAGDGSVLEDCVAQHNSESGISVGNGSVVRGCSARSNGGAGFFTGTVAMEDCAAVDNGHNGFYIANRDSSMRNCVASGNDMNGVYAPFSGINIHDSTFGNSGVHGIDLGQAQGGMITGCSVNDNGDRGISAGPDASIEASSVFNNGSNGIQAGDRSVVTSCRVDNSGANGILVGLASRVTDCSVWSNKVDGIVLTGDGVIANNQAAYNVFAGIRTSSSKNAVHGNVLTRNGTGLQVDSFGSIIYGNKAVSSTSGNNYQIAVDNKVGVIVAPPNSPAITGSTGGSGLGTTDPWANFSY